MDQPAAKKRRLAPKIEAQASPPHPQPFPHDPPPAQHYQVQELAPPPPERHEFESFARHLQDAAMLICRQTQKPPYSRVSVLLLTWEDDSAAEQDVAGLESVLRDRYNYRTERWSIPTVSNPSIKLGVRVASFLEHVGPDHLLMVYYAGHGFIGPDNQVFWACNAREDAPKFRWNSFRCLFEETQADILFLLDTYTSKEQPATSGNNVKQVLATGNFEQSGREQTGARSFTSHVTEAFIKLSTGRPFGPELLRQEIIQQQQRQRELVHTPGLTNGASKALSIVDKSPAFYTLAPGKGQAISFPSLPPNPAAQLQSPHLTSPIGETEQLRPLREDSIIPPSSVANLTFDEPRVLVCTTFVGEASPDMSSFNHWLQNTPQIASKITVEGMFLGPPTMLLISMPLHVWNVVQHDKVCCFLGYVNSHNMTHVYDRLVGSVSVTKATAKDVEDGRMLLEAREVATATPVIPRHDYHRDPNQLTLHPETPIRSDGKGRVDPMNPPPSAVSIALTYGNSTPGTGTGIANKDEVEDSAEMQEAAEQLKALSHVRHLSDDAASAARAQSLAIDATADVKREERPSHEANEAGVEGTPSNAERITPSRSKPRRSLQKQPPKQETRCTHCSHAPFKDSSSLRKHIAAAHTRPFPCAFAFAGCTSTFGSKNEWKRHISSQHLCLQYYRCSSCPQNTAEGKGNEFNRKDLFTQHLRRMHAPFAIKKAIAKGDSKLQVEWESHVKEMQQSCLVTRRQPPQRSACPKPDCASVFEGPTSWDEWTEHVGRHMEKGEASRLGVDRLLAKWALAENIIEWKEDGEYRLCGNNSNGTEKESNNHTTGYQSDGNKRDQEDRTIIAASTIVEKMDVDG